MTTRPTALELSVLRDVAAGKDPWGPTGSRRVSQALGRLRRKGLLLEYGYCPGDITDAGRAALEKEES